MSDRTPSCLRAWWAAGSMAAAIVCLTSGARAQDLYRVPGADLVPFDEESPAPGPPIDAAGFAWGSAPPFSWAVACWDPADPDGTRRVFNPYGLDSPGSIATWATTLVQGDGAWLVEQSANHAELLRLRCGDAAPGQELRGEALDPMRRARWSNLAGTPVLARSDLLCFFDTTRVSCFDPSAATDPAAAPPMTTRLDVAELDALVDLDPAWDAPATLEGRPPAVEAWELDAPLVTSEGRIFVRATRVWGSHADGSGVGFAVSWLLELTSDAVEVRYTGLDRGTLSRLVELPRFEGEVTIAVFPVEYEEWSSWVVSGCGPEGCVSYEVGWSGLGMRVVQPDLHRTGYLSMTNAVVAAGGILGPSTEVQSTPRGDLAVTLLDENYRRLPPLRLHLDPAHLDLDDDGLTTAEEAALGTSDFRPDSDGGGARDGLEMRLYGADPRDDGDDPPASAADGAELTALVASPLMGMVYDFDPRFGPGGRGFSSCVRSTSTLGPMCCDGACRDPSGEVVRRYDPTTAVCKSHDGRFLLHRTERGLERQHLADGRVELAVSEDLIAAHIPGARVFIPVDAHRTWVIREEALANLEEHGVAVLFEDGREPVRAYDHGRARRDSGLSPSFPGRFRAAGWMPAEERLLLAVEEHMDYYLVAVGTAGDAQVIMRGRTLAGMADFDTTPIFGRGGYEPDGPAYLFTTPAGDLVTNGGIMTQAFTFPPLVTRDFYYESRLSGAWGDTMILDDTGLELVRYDVTEVARGDLLVLRDERDPALGFDVPMLHRSGARGGLAPIWPRFLRDVTDIRGMALSQEGRLCIADGGGATPFDLGLPEVLELEPAAPGAPPELLIDAQNVGETLDCGYDEAGRLLVLTRTALLRRERLGEALAQVEALTGGSGPEALVERPDGTLRIQTAADGVRGMLYLADGRLVTMRRSDWSVRVDGEVVVDLPRLVHHDLGDPNATPYAPDHPGDVAFAERPDGRLVVAAHHVAPNGGIFGVFTAMVVVDLATGDTGYLAPGSYFAGADLGLVRVPGGDPGDPWGRNTPPPLPPTPEVPPLAPEAPTGGTPSAAPPACAGGGAAGSVALALTFVAWCRRRARGSPPPPGRSPSERRFMPP